MDYIQDICNKTCSCGRKTIYWQWLWSICCVWINVGSWLKFRQHFAVSSMVWWMLGQNNVFTLRINKKKHIPFEIGPGCILRESTSLSSSAILLSECSTSFIRFHMYSCKALWMLHTKEASELSSWRALYKWKLCYLLMNHNSSQNYYIFVIFLRLIQQILDINVTDHNKYNSNAKT
jgi:hypothetical protein